MYNKCIVHVFTYLCTYYIIQLTFRLSKILVFTMDYAAYYSEIVCCLSEKWCCTSEKGCCETIQVIFIINFASFTTKPFVQSTHKFFYTTRTRWEIFRETQAQLFEIMWGKNVKWAKQGDGRVTVWSTYQILLMLWTNPF